MVEHSHLMEIGNSWTALAGYAKMRSETGKSLPTATPLVTTRKEVT